MAANGDYPAADPKTVCGADDRRFLAELVQGSPLDYKVPLRLADIKASGSYVMVSGMATSPSLGGGDFPFDHTFGSDFNMDVVLDTPYTNAAQRGGVVRGDLHVELAEGQFPHEERSPGPAAGQDWEEMSQLARQGIYQPFIPDEGSRVLVMGHWIVDCGHLDFQTELHPITFMATARQQRRTHRGRRVLQSLPRDAAVPLRSQQGARLRRPDALRPQRLGAVPQDPDRRRAASAGPRPAAVRLDRPPRVMGPARAQPRRPGRLARLRTGRQPRRAPRRALPLADAARRAASTWRPTRRPAAPSSPYSSAIRRSRRRPRASAWRRGTSSTRSPPRRPASRTSTCRPSSARSCRPSSRAGSTRIRSSTATTRSAVRPSRRCPAGSRSSSATTCSCRSTAGSRWDWTSPTEPQESPSLGVSAVKTR